MTTQVFTTKQIAKLLKIGEPTVRQHVRAGIIRALPGRNIRIPKHALEEFLQSATRGQK